MSASRNQAWHEIWEAKGRTAATDLHVIDGYDLLPAREWEGMIATLAAPCGLRPGMDVVELGCGAGAFLATLRQLEPGLRLEGLDYAASLIAIARARLPGRFHVGDIRDCPAVGSATADLACSFGALIYLDSDSDVRRTLVELDRVTRPGGRIYIGEISDLAKREAALRQRRSTHAGRRQVSTREVDHLYLPKDLFLAESRRLGWRNVVICDHSGLPALAGNPLAAYRFSVYAEKNGGAAQPAAP